MKRFLFQNPEGKFLNTEYRTGWKHGIWRDRENARMYKTVLGIMQAFRVATPAIKTHLGLTIPKRDRSWTNEDREQNRSFWQAFSKLHWKQRLALYEQDGYRVIEVTIRARSSTG